MLQHITKITLWIIIYGFLNIFIFNINVQGDELKFLKDRQKMVHEQLKLRNVKDAKVLEAMSNVPRHLFIPAKNQKYAYKDRPVAIGYGQTISQPFIVAFMTELLSLNSKSKVLEIGTGSGYQAAILAEIVMDVYTIEIVEPLYKKSKSLFEKLDYKNIHTKYGDGYYGWQEKGPYDGIIVTCASEFIPPSLIKQLKIGGLLCIPVGPIFGIQNLLLIRKKDKDNIETEVICQVRFVPLTRKK